jgi:hypothetical protein
MMTRRLLLLTSALASAFSLSVGFPAAAAEETDTAAKLPGVGASHSIVAAEPPAEPVAKDADEPIRVGDWEIRISGSVSVQVGFGDEPQGRGSRR